MPDGIEKLRAQNCAAHDLNRPLGLLLLISPVAAGLAIGYEPQTTYNKLHHEKFPIQTVDREGCRMVRVVDLLKYVDDLPGTSKKPAIKKRGAPTKRERILKAKTAAAQVLKGGA